MLTPFEMVFVKYMRLSSGKIITLKHNGDPNQCDYCGRIDAEKQCPGCGHIYESKAQ